MVPGATISTPNGGQTGPSTTQNIGAGAIAFQRPDSKFVVVAAGNSGSETSVTKIYDPSTNTFISGPSLPLNAGAGTNAFQRQNGKFVVLIGGTNQTASYDPGTAKDSGSATKSATLTAAIGAGSQVLRRSDGKFLIVLGNSTQTTNIYDPTAFPVGTGLPATDSGSFTPGPNLTANVTTGSFAFETIYGKWIVGLGGTQTTNFYDPSTGLFTAGPSWSGVSATNAGAGTHVIQRPDYTYLILLGGSSVTVIYNPQTNSYTLGPSLATGTLGAGAHSFQRSDGKWVTVNGGGTVTANLYDPVANSFSDPGSSSYLFTGNTASNGALSFQRPDGKYVIISGNNGRKNTTVYDAGWNTTGTWTSEGISSANISTLLCSYVDRGSAVRKQ